MGDDIWHWAAAFGVPLISGVITLWVRAHLTQTKRIDDLAKSNTEAHQRLHEKIDKLDSKSQAQHSVVRDKIERILEYLIKDGRS